MALPWLESLPVWGSPGSRRRLAARISKALAALFMGNGISPDHWWAKGSGAEMQLSNMLHFLVSLIYLNFFFFFFFLFFIFFPLGFCIFSWQPGKGPFGGFIAAWTGRRDQDRSCRHCSPAWCSAASSPLPATMKRTFRWPTAPTFRGDRDRSLCRWKFTPPWLLIACSTTKAASVSSILDRVQEHAAHSSRQVSRTTRPSWTSSSPASAKSSGESSGCARGKDAADENAADKGRPSSP